MATGQLSGDAYRAFKKDSYRLLALVSRDLRIVAVVMIVGSGFPEMQRVLAVVVATVRSFVF